MKTLRNFEEWLFERTHAEIDSDIEKGEKFDEELEKLSNAHAELLQQEYAKKILALDWPLEVDEKTLHYERNIYFKTSENTQERRNYPQINVTVAWALRKDPKKRAEMTKLAVEIGENTIKTREELEKVENGLKIGKYVVENRDKIIKAFEEVFEIEKVQYEEQDRERSKRNVEPTHKLKDEKQKLSEDEILDMLRKGEEHEVKSFEWDFPSSRRGRTYKQDGLEKIKVIGWKANKDKTELRNEFIVELSGPGVYPRRFIITRKEMITLAKMFLPQFRGERVSSDIGIA
jgi:hypothetical protein